MSIKIILIGIATIWPALSACSSRTENDKDKDNLLEMNSHNSKGSIGSATMRENGVIILQLRAEAEDGRVGHGYLEYPPEHPQYNSIIEHLNGLNPGESKPVPPWPDNSSRD